MHFRDREDAGRRLGELVASKLDGSDVMVLGLDPGGLPVAVEVARRLRAPCDVFVVRKLLVPDADPSVSLGALATGGIQVIDEGLIERRRIPEPVLAAVVAQEMRELRRRELMLRRQRVDYEVRDRRALLVDDGLATGAKMRAAIAAVRRLGAREVHVAVPVCAAPARAAVEREADGLFCMAEGATADHYDRFDALDDAELLALLDSVGPTPV